MYIKYISKNMAFRKQFNLKLNETNPKNELKCILNETPINVDKLKNFVTKSVPVYRPLVWKILLGIIPRFRENQKCIQEQHDLIFNDLVEALNCLGLAAPIVRKENSQNGHINIDSFDCMEISISNINNHIVDEVNLESEHFFLMWLISEAKLDDDPEILLNNSYYQKLIRIGHRIQNNLENSQDTFHVCRYLWKILKDNDAVLRKNAQQAVTLLKKKNTTLHRHLASFFFFADPFLETQSLCLFCDIFPDSSIESIIDKIFSGNFDIIITLIVTLLTQLQSNFFGATSLLDVKNVLYQIRKEKADVIISLTLEDWHIKACAS